ncbi:MAG: orotidine-5'-phosphate decarboxylase [Burkholderiales bacterium]
MPNKLVIVALDFPQAKPALELAARLDPAQCRVKVGKELFTAAGPQLVEALVKRGFDVFLDLKFHDIPNTVAGACKAAASLGVWMLNVHALGGDAMLRAAREAIDSGAHKPLLLGVTILTSMGDKDLIEVGLHGTSAENVLRLARLVKNCALDGVVCSSQEAQMVRREIDSPFVLVTPGIRLFGAIKDDQARVLTPQEALHAGADYLVIGRPVTQATDPLATLRAINQNINIMKATQ